MIRTGVILRRGPSTANKAFRFRKVTGLSWNVSSDARRPDSERSLTEVKRDFELLLLRTRMRMRRNHGTNTAHRNRQERLRANLKVRCQIPKPDFFLVLIQPLKNKSLIRRTLSRRRWPTEIFVTPAKKIQSLLGPVGSVNSTAKRASDADPYFKTSSSTLNLEL